MYIMVVTFYMYLCTSCVVYYTVSTVLYYN